MRPDLELVQARDGQSCKTGPHGCPCRTARWRFHPECELHLVTAAEGGCVGDPIGPFRAGDLVSQFTGDFMAACMMPPPRLRVLGRGGRRFASAA